jgi:predicted nucleic acid-binding protein
VIYLDSSVALAHLLAEDRTPSEAIWSEVLTSSRLCEYEIWNRIKAAKLHQSHAPEVRTLLDRIALIELEPTVLARALEPFPTPVRTLDALHLASMEFIRSRMPDLRLATYDDRLAAAARALRIPLASF